MSWKRRLLWIGGSLLAVILVAGGYLWYQVWIDGGCACGLDKRTPSTVYNPLRDRSPEKVATQYLESMKTGDCLKLPAAYFTSAETQTTLCAAHYSLRDWQLRSRKNDKGSTYLGYEVAWGTMQDRSDPLDMILVRNGTIWQIQSIDKFY